MKIFISFSSQDQKLVTDLTRALQNRGADVWTYLLEMKPGDSLIDKINTGIKSSDYLILVISADSLQSYWVTRELNAAMMLEADGKIKVIPILIDDSKKNLPPLLHEKIYADFRTDFSKGFRDLRIALGLAGMTDTVFHGTTTGERIISDDTYLEENGMKVLKRGDEVYVDMPAQKQYAKITDEEAEFRTEYFVAKWDNVRNSLKELKIDLTKYHPTYSQNDVLEELERRVGEIVQKKVTCKFGAEFILFFDAQGKFLGINANEHCKTSINVKTMEVNIQPSIPK